LFKCLTNDLDQGCYQDHAVQDEDVKSGQAYEQSREQDKVSRSTFRS